MGETSVLHLTSSGISAFFWHPRKRHRGSFGFQHYNLPAFSFFVLFLLSNLFSERAFVFEKGNSHISTSASRVIGFYAFTSWLDWVETDRIYKARAGPHEVYLRLVFIFPSKKKKVHAAMHPNHLPKKRTGQAYSDSWIPKTFLCLFYPSSCYISFHFFGFKRHKTAFFRIYPLRDRYSDTTCSTPVRTLASKNRFFLTPQLWLRVTNE